MDLYNNKVGIQTGKKYKYIPTTQLSDTIIQYIKENKLKVIK
jgi:hypothetical protein